MDRRQVVMLYLVTRVKHKVCLDNFLLETILGGSRFRKPFELKKKRQLGLTLHGAITEFPDTSFVCFPYFFVKQGVALKEASHNNYHYATTSSLIHKNQTGATEISHVLLQESFSTIGDWLRRYYLPLHNWKQLMFLKNSENQKPTYQRCHLGLHLGHYSVGVAAPAPCPSATW